MQDNDSNWAGNRPLFPKPPFVRRPEDLLGRGTEPGANTDGAAAAPAIRCPNCGRLADPIKGAPKKARTPNEEGALTWAAITVIGLLAAIAVGAFTASFLNFLGYWALSSLLGLIIGMFETFSMLRKQRAAETK